MPEVCKARQGTSWGQAPWRKCQRVASSDNIKADISSFLLLRSCYVVCRTLPLSGPRSSVAPWKGSLPGARPKDECRCPTGSLCGLPGSWLCWADGNTRVEL